MWWYAISNIWIRFLLKILEEAWKLSFCENANKSWRVGKKWMWCYGLCKLTHNHLQYKKINSNHLFTVCYATNTHLRNKKSSIEILNMLAKYHYLLQMLWTANFLFCLKAVIGCSNVYRYLIIYYLRNPFSAQCIFYVDWIKSEV